MNIFKKIKLKKPMVWNTNKQIKTNVKKPTMNTENPQYKQK